MLRMIESEMMKRLLVCALSLAACSGSHGGDGGQGGRQDLAGQPSNDGSAISNDGATPDNDGGTTPAVDAAGPPTSSCFNRTAPTAPTPAGSGSWTFDLDGNHASLGLVAIGDSAQLVATGSGTPYTFVVKDEQHRVIAYPTPVVGANGTYTYDLPTGCYGYYEISPTSGDASTLIPQLGSRPAGLLTYAVMPPPDKDPTNNFTDDFASIEGGVADPGDDGLSTGYFSWLGMTTIGIKQYSMGECETTSAAGCMSSLASDPFPALYKSAHLLPLFFLDGFPSWAGDPPSDLSATGPWGQYLDLMIPYLVKTYDFVPNRRYQITWEPNVGSQWPGTPAQLVQLYTTAYAKIHQYDTNAIVMGPAIAEFGEWISFFQDELDAGLAPYLDAESWHPYPVISQLVDPAQNDASIAQVRQMVATSKGKGIPFYGTESGISWYELAMLGDYTPGMTVPQNSYNTGCNITADNIDIVHAAANSWEALQEKADGAIMHTYFYTADYSSQPGYGVFYNNTAAYTFGPNKISPKVDPPMMRQTNALLNHADALGQIVKPNGNTSQRVQYFQSRQGKVITAVLYDTSGNTSTYNLPTGAAQVTVFDAFGNSQVMATSSGMLTVTLGLEPTYVQGIDSSALTGMTAAPATNE